MRELCPTRNYEVQLVREEDLDQARERVATLVDPNLIVLSRQERVLRFPTSESEDQLAGMLASLVQAGVSISQFREVASDLEDAFLSVAETPVTSPPQPAEESTASEPLAQG